ncbi:MAG TPA: outer membrane beta-barrel protein, partial [Kofleriaceae bacterium]
RLALAALVLAAAVPAHAQLYAGASLGRSDISVERNRISDPFLDLGFDSASTTSSDTATAYRAYAGYLFLPYLGVEAAYVDLGSFRFRTNVDPGGSLSGKPSIKGGELSVVGRLPIGERFALYGRAGLFSARTRTRYAATGSVELIEGAERQHKSSTKPSYAIGASYDFTQHLGVRAEWARYTQLGGDLTGGQTDANLASIGFTYTF